MMRTHACVLVLMAMLASPVVCVKVSSTSVLSFDAEDAKNRPVTKVINLLKDMLKTLQKEGDADEEIYDKLACWCDTNDKEKTKAIEVAEASIEKLTKEVEELTATSARLETEIEDLEKEVAANNKALDEATAIRAKEYGEFNGEEKDMLESISALKSAIAVLSKHHSFLQMPTSHIKGVAASVQNEMQKHSNLLDGVFTNSQRKTISNFVQNPSYAVRSGEIFGILKTMLETFESNLSAEQKEELASLKAYEELKAAKEAEIAAGQSQIDDKVQQKATANSKTAAAKESIEDTTASLAADQEYLRMLKEKCSLTDAEWEDRQKTRAGEMEAVSKALAILSSDDSHDLFTKTFNAASFVQKQTATDSARRMQASKLLATVAQKVHNPRLANLAVTLRLDAFTRVKKVIDDMVAELTKEKNDEISHRDWCIKSLNENEADTTKKENEKSDLLALMSDLESTISVLTGEIETLTKELDEASTMMKRAGEDREKENMDFQSTLADQRDTQKVLTSALTVLKTWYAPKEVAMVQRQEPVGPPPPPGFSTFKPNENSGGVMGLLETIIADAKTMESETIRAEEDAQKSYEDLVKDTNAVIEAKTAEKINKSSDKAKAESSLVEATKDKDDAVLELEQLANYNGELHKSCDYIMKNFEIRQTARDEEIEALKQAKAILSGAKFQEFLQSS
mmetsp:Transcript_76513/g.135574  ORF Transcript_76513/g.135574 Transcript_76513/m.135574 type:complete len:684 (-) Transcript_76513:104-2155(-)